MAPSVHARTPRSQALDNLIMSTNSSSIVSKRSVERLYYPDEPHYFRYFVKKFQRRAPLINRGYWLRLRAIDVVVRQFLAQKTRGKKLIINLGCGSDVLPWQSQVRYKDGCKNALFVDVDYPDLMHKKRAIVLETPQLRELLGDSFEISSSEKDLVLLKSENYCQLGCDLRDLDSLRNVLETLADLSECSVLFVAEVSITYMDTESADNLLQWARSVGKAEFCLLEQLLPYGPNHPFAQTMLRHFDKLKTPPRSVEKYPTVNDQHERFTSRGWASVRIWDLWEAWCCGDFVNAQERMSLDSVEPFDEWEEFMLFARHYFVLHAIAIESKEFVSGSGGRKLTNDRVPCKEIEAQMTIVAGNKRRKFGASLGITDAIGQSFGLHMMGLGANAREDSYDIYSLDGAITAPTLPVTGPSSRMCFTITDLGSYGSLLVGGRGSPDDALSDCWILTNDNGRSWKSTWKLPTPLYRHACLKLPGTSLALVAGGKMASSQISGDYFVFHPERGWLRCNVEGDVPEPTFGSILFSGQVKEPSGLEFQGFLCGGMEKTGLIMEKTYSWTLDMTLQQPGIVFSLLTKNLAPELYTFGACITTINDMTVVCGGMGAHPSVNGHAVYLLSASESGFEVARVNLPGSPNKPFMIGSTVMNHDGCIIIVGGGATCFSMGTFWESNIYQLHLRKWLQIDEPEKIDRKHKHIEAKFISSQRIVRNVFAHKGDTDRIGAPDVKAKISKIPRVSLNSASEFETILREGQPIVIENLNLGPCVQKWTAEYMTERVGCSRQVVVHECEIENGKMDFMAKNFRYATSSFGTVMTRAKQGDGLYLRSLSTNTPAEKPAKLEEDFPGLAQDFSLPGQLAYVREQLFSSVLRVSGRVDMWLHYDVMANVYAQIIGSKRMVLFPPSDVLHLAFAPGASSSSTDVFSWLETPKLASTHPFEATVNAGDVLFLPPLWLHTATPTADMSVVVNVFFRDLDSGYAAGRDVYGNRDLAAYEKGRQEVAKITKQFQQLPVERRKFYLTRLADELLEAADA